MRLTAQTACGPFNSSDSERTETLWIIQKGEHEMGNLRIYDIKPLGGVAVGKKNSSFPPSFVSQSSMR